MMGRLELTLYLWLLAEGFGSCAEPLEFSIQTTWNGEIVDHLTINITLSVSGENELRVDIKAPYFNSINPETELVLGNCPQRPGEELFNYEVVEVFFLNDKEEYLEMEVAPNGQYLNIMLAGRRQDILNYLPMFKSPPTVSNPCSSGPKADSCIWTASFLIPGEYLPQGVRAFNAFGVHGEMVGEVLETHYEALYPVSPEDGVTEPDFHYLEAFEPIDLAVIGYQQPSEESVLWTQAKQPNQPIGRSYELTVATDCVRENVAHSGFLTRRTEAGLVINVTISDKEYFKPNISNEFMVGGPNEALYDRPSESAWIIFSNEDDQALRLGVNPYAAYHISLMEGDEILTNITLADNPPTCLQHVTNPSAWDCQIQISMEYFPKNVKYFQLVHHHQPLMSISNTSIPDAHIIAVLCPGNVIPSDSEALEGVDWRGCLTDNRHFLDPIINSEDSQIWLDLKPENENSGQQIMMPTALCVLFLALLHPMANIN